MSTSKKSASSTGIDSDTPAASTDAKQYPDNPYFARQRLW